MSIINPYSGEEVVSVKMAKDVLPMPTASPETALWQALILWKCVVVLLNRVGDVGVGVVR